MKLKKLNPKGFSHDIVFVLVIVLFAVGGVAYLVASHADQLPATTGTGSSAKAAGWTSFKDTSIQAGELGSKNSLAVGTIPSFYLIPATNNIIASYMPYMTNHQGTFYTGTTGYESDGRWGGGYTYDQDESYSTNDSSLSTIFYQPNQPWTGDTASYISQKGGGSIVYIGTYGPNSIPFEETVEGPTGTVYSSIGPVSAVLNTNTTTTLIYDSESNPGEVDVLNNNSGYITPGLDYTAWEPATPLTTNKAYVQSGNNTFSPSAVSMEGNTYVAYALKSSGNAAPKQVEAAVGPSDGIIANSATLPAFPSNNESIISGPIVVADPTNSLVTVFVPVKTPSGDVILASNSSNGSLWSSWTQVLNDDVNTSTQLAGINNGVNTLLFASTNSNKLYMAVGPELP